MFNDIYVQGMKNTFNNVLNTFYTWLRGDRHMVKDHSDSERKPTATTTWDTFFD